MLATILSYQPTLAVVFAAMCAAMVLGFLGRARPAGFFKLALIGSDEHLRDTPVSAFPLLARLATVLSIFVIALCAINFVSVVLQCGLSECHTFGYKLPGGKQ